MSIALYRRYRPDNFADVIGQEHVTAPLMAALDAGRVTHAYLFSGPRGCGKTTSARIMARCLNCAAGPSSVPCGKCESCIELATGGPGSLDVVEIDAASHNGVDDARELRERAAFAPVRDRYKIFILDEAHMVTSQGFNALLKLVEEPPEHVKFIFATTEPEKVIGTIRSRTHHYPFRLVPPETMQNYLRQLCASENMEIAEGVLPLVVRAGAGSVRDSLSVLDQLMAGSKNNQLDYETAIALLGYTDVTLLEDFIAALIQVDATAVFTLISKVIETGLDPRRFVEDLLLRLRDLLMLAFSSGEQMRSAMLGLPLDQVEIMLEQARGLGARTISQAADITNQALSEMTGATAPRLQIELLGARLLLLAEKNHGENASRGAASPESFSRPGRPEGSPRPVAGTPGNTVDPQNSPVASSASEANKQEGGAYRQNAEAGKHLAAPAAPTIPEAPSAPATASATGIPNGTGMPSATGIPNAASTPVAPSAPVDPDTFAASNTPAAPNTPVTPVAVSTRDESAAPSAPVAPSVPVEPAAPVASNTPAAPTTLAAPSTSSAAGDSAEPIAPAVPERPAAPVAVDIPVAPDTPITSNSSVAPNSSVAASVPVAPVGSSAPTEAKPQAGWGEKHLAEDKPLAEENQLAEEKQLPEEDQLREDNLSATPVPSALETASALSPESALTVEPDSSAKSAIESENKQFPTGTPAPDLNAKLPAHLVIYANWEKILGTYRNEQPQLALLVLNYAQLSAESLAEPGSSAILGNIRLCFPQGFGSTLMPAEKEKLEASFATSLEQNKWGKWQVEVVFSYRPPALAQADYHLFTKLREQAVIAECLYRENLAFEPAPENTDADLAPENKSDVPVSENAPAELGTETETGKVTLTAVADRSEENQNARAPELVPIAQQASLTAAQAILPQRETETTHTAAYEPEDLPPLPEPPLDDYPEEPEEDPWLKENPFPAPAAEADPPSVAAVLSPPASETAPSSSPNPPMGMAQEPGQPLETPGSSAPGQPYAESSIPEIEEDLPSFSDPDAEDDYLVGIQVVEQLLEAKIIETIKDED